MSIQPSAPRYGVTGQHLVALGLVDVGRLDPSLHVALAYASPDNFLEQNVYGDLNAAFLQPEAADKLLHAHALLKRRHGAYSFLIWDCARPFSVQKQMWDLVRGTIKQNFIANPETGVSVHNFGCAVDLTITCAGIPLDMGTTFDDFTPLAHTEEEPRLVQEGLLSPEQLRNRLLLREIMVEAGFLPISEEWWHFNALPKEEARKRYPLIE